MDNKPEILDFSEQWQDALIGYLLTNNIFFVTNVNLLKSQWFVDPINANLLKILQEYHKQYNRQPNQVELNGLIQLKFPSSLADFNRYIDKIQLCKATCNNVRFDLLTDKLLEWIKAVKLKESIMNAANLYKSGDYTKTFEYLSTQVQYIKNLTLNENDVVQLDNPIDFLKEFKKKKENCVTIGHEDFDELLLPGSKISTNTNNRLSTATRGSLILGDTTIIMGASNAGKTTAGVTIVTANAVIKKDVLYIICEQKWEDIYVKLLSNISNIPIQDLHIDQIRNYYLEDYKLNVVTKYLHNKIKLINWVKPGHMFVEEVIDRITAEQEKKIQESGKGYDLLVVDYPGKLRAHKFNNKSILWEEIDYVYDQFITLASFYRFHAILFAQTNREGYKVGNTNDNGKLIDQGHIGMSFGIVQKADNVITINRGVRDKQIGLLKFYITKSRSAPTEKIFLTETDYSVSRTHGYGLRCTIIDQTDPRQMGIDLTDTTLSEFIGASSLSIESKEKKRSEVRKTILNNKITED